MAGRRAAVVLAIATISGALGCGPAAFACQDDQECLGDGQGFCEADGACSFPDPSCPSGRRYGDLGPADVAGECVPGGNDTGTGDDDGDSVGVGTSSGGGDTLDDGSDPGDASADTTGADDDTTGVITTDPADSASETNTTTTTTSTTTSTTTDSNGDSDPYGPCDGDRGCGASAQCEPSGALPLTCAEPCETDDECPAPTSGTASPVCVPLDDAGSWCVLPCASNGNGADCPDGMECSEWQPEIGELCTWF